MNKIHKKCPAAEKEVIDFHAHILPSVDDGARDMDESLELLKTAYENGIRTIYCTPHYRRRESNLPVKDTFLAFCREAEKKYPQIYKETELFLGHELVYHEELPERLASGEAFFLGDSNKILIEFAPGISYPVMFRQLRVLVGEGYTPVIAHMERCEALKNRENVLELKTNGCLMQVNFQSITGDSVTGKEALLGGLFSPDVRRVRSLIREGLIDLFGTDMHRRDYRPPLVKKQVAWLTENGIMDH